MLNCIFVEPAEEAEKPDQIMIDATQPKAFQKTASLLKGRLFAGVSGAPKAA